MLKPPKTTRAEVSYTMITKGKVSLLDHPLMARYRTRISELRLEYDFVFNSKPVCLGKNIHGNTKYMQLHTLPKNQKHKAIKVYNQINKK